MITFQEMYETVQDEISDSSDETLVFIKRWLNLGIAKFRAGLGRPYTRLSKTTNLVADQQYYQLPEDAIRPTGVVVTVDGVEYPLREIASETIWRAINANAGTSAAIPEAFFVRGNDEIGLFPTPSEATAAGLEVYYEPKIGRLTQDNYTTGTVTVTNGSAAITHSGTGFTEAMVGRYFRVEDSADGLAYRIAAFVSTSELTLENYYAGDSASGVSFVIGEASGIPDEFEEAPMDYCLHRLYLRKRNRNFAGEYKALFDSAIDNAKQAYASKTSGRVVASPLSMGYSIYDPIHRSPGEITT